MGEYCPSERKKVVLESKVGRTITPFSKINEKGGWVSHNIGADSHPSRWLVGKDIGGLRFVWPFTAQHILSDVSQRKIEV